MEKQVKTWLNREEHPDTAKKFTMPSATVPDQTMSIKEILTRHAHGLPLGGSQEGLYDEEGTSQGIDIRTLDLVDIQAMKIANKEYIKDTQDYIEAKKKLKKAKDEEKQQPEGH
jgi:hypothetical protein